MRIKAVRLALTMSGLFVTIILQNRCATPPAAVVEEVDGNQSRPLALAFGSLDARREGARVKAVVTFEGAGRRIRQDSPSSSSRPSPGR